MMKEIINKYLSSNATTEEKQQLLAWLKDNPDGKRLLNLMSDEHTASNLPQVSDDDVHAAFNRFRDTIAVTRARARKPRRLLMLRVAAVAALLIVCSAGGYYAGRRGAPLGQSAVSTIVNRVVMGSDSKGTITLPDGTVAWLNVNSRLIYPEVFDDDNRTVKLEGEGFFDVVPDKKRPFIVESGGMTVTALGTSFDIRNYTGRLNMETVLLSGKVAVSFAGSNEAVTLEPGQSVVYDNRSAEFKVRKVIASDHIIWTLDKLSFKDEKLSTILYKMEKWYGVKFEADSNIPADMRLSLTIKKESKEEIFSVLEMIAPISFSGDADNVHVHTSRRAGSSN